MEFINKFIRSLNNFQKVLFLLFLFNFFLGPLVLDELNLIDLYVNPGNTVSFFELFDFEESWFYWVLNILLIFGIYLFKDERA